MNLTNIYKEHKTSSHKSGKLFPILSFMMILLLINPLQAQKVEPLLGKTPKNDSLFTLKFQQTVISQYKTKVKSPYEGEHSTPAASEEATSLTATVFGGIRLWKNASIFMNMELAGGSGVGKAVGVAGFINGETFRIGNPKPILYVARLYLRQLIPLNNDRVFIKEDFNQVAGYEPTKYLSFNIGKYSLADFFDDNSFSHDPRTQFFNWSLMSAGAWDYPANVRGYTYSLTTEYISKQLSLRLGGALVPDIANGPFLDLKVQKANSLTFEIEKPYYFGKDKSQIKGKVRGLLFYNQSHSGNYKSAVNEGIINNTVPDISLSRKYSRRKYGFALGWEHQLSQNVGLFSRLSYNDGKNETWAFTEIDHSFCLGTVVSPISIKSRHKKRVEDKFGAAFVINGISKGHQKYLGAGGQGFMLGDGKLNYGNEMIFETYYSLKIKSWIWATPDYQYIINPGYNKDRGGFSAIALRCHIEI